ncbi:MAG: Crp/Fnr family transcriptional regulator [Oceanidesulfovibrio sp.]
MDVLDFLRGVELFKGLPEEQLTILARHAHWRDYDTGDVIIAEKESLRGLYIQVSGRSKIFRSTSDGREQTIYIFGPGEPFCLCSLFAESSQPATAMAMEPSRVLSVSDTDFTAMAEDQPRVIFGMLLIMSRRLKEAMDMIESLSVREIPVRLANFLVHASGESGLYVLPMTHRELAKIIGATPEALSRAFRKLADHRLVAIDGREVRILDVSGLRALAGIPAR